MTAEKETVLTLIEELKKGLLDGTLTTDQEEKLRDDISDLQMNVIVGDLLED
jgi:hypothetical protein